MYHSILVPLDGSAFAEQALPLAVDSRSPAGAALELVQVHALYALNEPAAPGCLSTRPWTPPSRSKSRRTSTPSAGAPPTREHQSRPLCRSDWRRTAFWIEPARRADLIVMTTHGRGPVSRFFLGSVVADEVVRRSPVPVLLCGPTTARATRGAAGGVERADPARRFGAGGRSAGAGGGAGPPAGRALHAPPRGRGLTPSARRSARWGTAAGTARRGSAGPTCTASRDGCTNNRSAPTRTSWSLHTPPARSWNWRKRNRGRSSPWRRTGAAVSDGCFWAVSPTR